MPAHVYLLMSEEPMPVGIIGCGKISGIYLQNAPYFRHVRITACADVDEARARATAEEAGLKAMSVEDLLGSDVQIVLNLTPPEFHEALNRRILEAGKHAYCEKPLATKFEDGQATVALAKEKGLHIACAPDTVLGAGITTARRVLDEGWIGEPLGGSAFLLSHGPEGWHPNPGFFYQPGGGPLFDMGPYYLTTLVHLLGPVRRIQAIAKRFDNTRLATSPEIFGKKLPVDVDTCYFGTLEFAGGALVTANFSFDVWAHGHAPIEIYGREGSLAVPDPNTFGGPVRLLRKENRKEREWKELPLVTPYAANSRFLGVADLAAAIQEGRSCRANGELALHVLEVLCAYGASSESGKAIDITTQPELPARMPSGRPFGML